MSLVKSRELFVESAFPIAVDTVGDRTLIQKELHRHEYFEMLFVEKGSLINRFKGDEILMKPGDVLIMKPYVLHLLADAVKKQSRKAYCCSFLPQAVDFEIQSLEKLKNSSSPNKYFFKPFISLAEEGVSAVQLKFKADQRADLIALFQQLRETAHDLTDRGQALTRYHFLDLLAFLAEQYDRNKGVDRMVQVDLAVPVSRYLSGLRSTLNYIHDHFEESLKLEDMAAMSGASETYFCRLFKHETGMTFLNYLNGLRIERACVLLRDTTENALDICYQVGFNDYTHFGRQFKKHIGMSPAEFRKKNPQHVRRFRDA
ncbi:AraC family transcriptional regulator [Pontiella sulfatireligans]|uniref:Transposon Tn10 TetD protein n=1 Tax=Pontiella sulfatireligans TaxID=2750658 RepID=A0A6C2UR48_9BACT|nr:AraC family transcriptional regulator [Pontiella sulfatireligans]VGO21731.1 Transposon Tn10 TetD protein [Pontiella sulfatireligans]